MEINQELLKQAMQTKSAEELLTLANNNGLNMTEEEAKEYFDQLNKSGELADDELDSVAGGGCGSDSPEETSSAVDTSYKCTSFVKKDATYTGIPCCGQCRNYGVRLVTRRNSAPMRIYACSLVNK